jgi:hypothetical protein
MKQVTPDTIEADVLRGGRLVLEPGVYPPIYIAVPGTVLEAKYPWTARVEGGGDHAIYANAPNCTVRGMQCMKAAKSGVKVEAGGKVLGCWVHHNGDSGIASHGGNGNEIIGNLVEFNGDDIQFDHGIYADGEGLLIKDNIVRFNSGYQIHLYPSLRGSRVEGNTMFEYGHGRCIALASGGMNVLRGNIQVESSRRIGDVVD